MITTRRMIQLGGAGAVGLLGVLLPLGAASAAPYPNGGGTTVVRPNSSQQSSQVAGTTAARSTLPITGGDAVGLAVIGGASAGIGAVLVRRSRRAASHS